MKSFFKKFFVIFLAVLLVTGIMNYKNIMILFGKGEVTVQDSDKASRDITSNPNYTNSSTKTEDGKKILTTQSIDKTTDIKVTSKGEKVEAVEVDLDASGLSEQNVKDELVKNLEPVLAATTPDYKAIELWAVREGAQKILKSGQNNFSIKQAFGDVVIEATGDLSTGKVKINILNNTK